MPNRKRTRRGLSQWITAAQTPLFVLNDRRVILVFNLGCERLTGWSAADVIGKQCDNVGAGDWESADALTAALCPPADVFQRTLTIAESLLVDRSGRAHFCRIHYILLPEGEEPAGPKRVLGVITAGEPAADEVVPNAGSAPAQWRVALARLAHQLRRQFQLDHVVAHVPEMRRVVAQLRLARAGLDPVHFYGERGAGKEYLARCLHAGTSSTSSRPFVPLDCAALGHFELKRALTRSFDPEAADEDRPGTLFLRHVDALPRDLQDLVLREATASPGRMRIVSSATIELDRAVETERIGAELACYLTPVVISVPPLRDRGDEVILLAQQILEQLNRGQDRQMDGFSPAVAALFFEYQWPGNVRELAAVVAEARRQCRSNIVDTADLPFRFRTGLQAQQIGPPRAAPPLPLDEYLAEVEAERIREALQAAGGNKTLAAQWLGIPRPRLYRRIESLGIDAPDDPTESTGTSGGDV